MGGSGQVLWTYTGRNKTLPPYTSLPVMDEIAYVNMALLGGYIHRSEKRARWAEGQIVGKLENVFPQGTLHDLICLAEIGVVCTHKITQKN